MLTKPIIHLLSGGLDSVALLHDLRAQGCFVHCLGFDYGQTHRAELKLAKSHAERLNLPFTLVELLQVKHLFLRSALTDGNGGNVVPNRNAVFLHIAAAMAASIGAESVTIGCNADDREDFPDCSEEFLNAVRSSLLAARVNVEICAPYVSLTKREIVLRARAKGYPIEESISCYSGNNCGTCDACVKRVEALRV